MLARPSGRLPHKERASPVAGCRAPTERTIGAAAFPHTLCGKSFWCGPAFIIMLKKKRRVRHEYAAKRIVT